MAKPRLRLQLQRAKKAHDKRESLKERQASREVDRELSRHATGKSGSKGKRKKSDQDYD